MVPINLFAQTKFIKVKWLVVCSIFLVILLIVSPIFVQLDNIQSKRETDAHKLVLKKISIDKPIKKITMARPVVKPSSFNVSIIANQGVSWISFQVDKNPTRKITLKKGSSIILKGESIKLVLGNYKALIIKNNKGLII